MPRGGQEETEGTTGTVEALWRYPVKSMLGEGLETVGVSEGGLLGDRSYAIVDRADGKVATAKNPRKWSRLFEFEARLSPRTAKDNVAPVWITFPDESVASSEQGDIDQLLSAELGREVSLRHVASQSPKSVYEYDRSSVEQTLRESSASDEALAEGTFFDAEVIHLITTSTLDSLAQLHPRGCFEARRFRPNIVLEDDGRERTVEDDWPGHTLSIGDEVRLKVLSRCPRCVMVTLPQGDLLKEPGILRATVQHNGGDAGVYANVLRGGRLSVGDPVTLE